MSTALHIEAAQFEPIFLDYINRLQRRQRVEQTITNCVNALRPFQAWLREQGIRAVAVTEEHLYDYFGRGVFAPGTNRVHATQVKAAYSYARKRGVEGLAKVDPFLDFEMPTAPNPDPLDKVIPNGELRKMRDDCTHPKQEILWALLTFSGMRRDEIRRLTWEMLDWSTASFSIIGKGGKRRQVPVHPVVQEILHEHNPNHTRTGAILSPNGASGRLTVTTGEPYSDLDKLAAHFTDRPMHSFRKTLASSLRKNKVPGDVIDKIFGWAPVGIRDTYYVAIDFDQLQDAIRKAYLNDPVA